MATEFIRVEFSARAKAELKSLPDSLRIEVMEEIRGLAEDPFPPGSKPLTIPGLHVISVYNQSLRVIYRLTKGRVIIERVRPREIAYDGM